ncbi:hypothetical protein HELRODRAFT_173420 [Helobdella robusta]|uniref:Thioredoxin domain-containing protein n=1 Tax=Helobdella robusta TaxID=6412 RepID=T1F6S9_HELRO|nr:hypothetical protein HELRODRAFT_173420 [Helobdella robusta]ESO03718.1 hypothetical protein HELRODRAFT_173420 [Helobdella robusta]
MELESTIRNASNKTIIIDFCAEWCVPCKALSPKLKDFAKSCPNIILVKVDVDDAEDVADKYGVTVLPTFVVIRNGCMADKLIGSELDKIEKMFKKYDDKKSEINI